MANFLRKLFRKRDRRPLYDGASVADDYDWSVYSEEYRAQIEKMSKQHTLLLKPGEYAIDGDDIVLKDGLKPLHDNHKCLYETVRLLEPASVLEFGCGGGDHLANLRELLPDAELRGFDRSEGQLQFLRQRHSGLNASVREQNITEPLPDDFPKADVIYSQAVIMHIHEGDAHLRALTNMCRFSKKAVVLMENWTRHDFVNDLRQLHEQGLVPEWDQMNLYFRRLEGKPYIMIASPHELPFEPLTDYDSLK